MQGWTFSILIRLDPQQGNTDCVQVSVLSYSDSGRRAQSVVSQIQSQLDPVTFWALLIGNLDHA